MKSALPAPAEDVGTLRRGQPQPSNNFGQPPEPRAEAVADGAQVTAFFDAVTHGRVEEIERLAQLDPRLLTLAEPSGSGPKTALSLATRAESVRAIITVARSLGLPLDINARVCGAMTPLVQAVSLGSIELVQELLDLGADPNVRSISLPLAQAIVATNGLALMRVLLAHGALVDGPARLDEHGVGSAGDAGSFGAALEPPLFKAAWTGNTEAALLLLEHGADGRCQHPKGMALVQGRTASEVARSFNHHATAEAIEAWLAAQDARRAMQVLRGKSAPQ